MKKIIFLIAIILLSVVAFADDNDYDFVITNIKWANGTLYSGVNNTHIALYDSFAGGNALYNVTKTLQYDNGTVSFVLYDVNEANYTTPTTYLQLVIETTVLARKNISTFKRFNTSAEMQSVVNNALQNSTVIRNIYNNSWVTTIMNNGSILYNYNYTYITNLINNGSIIYNINVSWFWNYIANGSLQFTLRNSSNITCVGDQCWYNGTTSSYDDTTVRQSILDNSTSIRNSILDNATAIKIFVATNITSVRADILNNLTLIRTELSNNITMVRGNIDSNISSVRADIATNISSFLKNGTNINILSVNATTINGTNMVILGNITSEYLFAQPITGSIGSGLIWMNQSTAKASLNISVVSGLNVFYPAFLVRLVQTNLSSKICNISAGIVTVPNDQHTVYYVDNNCAIQNTPIATYVVSDISPGGFTDFMNVMAHSGKIEVLKGVSMQQKVEVKTKLLILKTDHLRVISGFGRTTYLYRNISIDPGEYQYIREVAATSYQNTSQQGIEFIYLKSSAWTYENKSSMNFTQCNDGTNLIDCTLPNKYRRYFIFASGFNVSGIDNTRIHQLAGLDARNYVSLADCLDTNTNPLTYTIPSVYTYTAVLLYAYCGKPSSTAWESGWIDLRTTKQASVTASSTPDIYVELAGDTMTGTLVSPNVTSNWFSWEVMANNSEWMRFNGSRLYFDTIYANQTCWNIVNNGTFATKTGLNNNISALKADIATNISNVRTSINNNITMVRSDLINNITTILTNGTLQIGLLNSSNITCVGNQCWYNGTSSAYDDTAVRQSILDNRTIISTWILNNDSDVRTSILNNISTLRADIATNISNVRTDITNNISNVRTSISNNMSDIRAFIATNITSVRGDIANNVTMVRTDLTNNISSVRADIATNLSTLRADIATNISNVRTDIGNNVTMLRTSINNNISTLRADIATNISVFLKNNTDINVLRVNATSVNASLNVTAQGVIIFNNTKICFDGATCLYWMGVETATNTLRIRVN